MKARWLWDPPSDSKLQWFYRSLASLVSNQELDLEYGFGVSPHAWARCQSSKAASCWNIIEKLPAVCLMYVKVCCSVPKLRPTLCDPVGCSTPCPPQVPEDCSPSPPPSRRCHPAISFSAALFSFCLQSFPALGPFPMHFLFAFLLRYESEG